MKKHLFKIILGGFIVFLALPVIFDSDDTQTTAAKSASASASAAGGQQETAEAMLPVVQKAMPFRAENVLSKYAGRFKRFYVNPKEEKQKISQEIMQEQNGAVYASADSFGSGINASYGRAASAEDEAYAKEYFTDVETRDAPPSQGAIAADVGTKQRVHDNAPVKGLYESSAIDSPEARIKAKEVYSNVMNRVDTTTASASGSYEEEYIPSAPVSGKNAVYASASQEHEGEQRVAKAESKYIGIASKGSRPASASSGSASGGFGGGGISAKDADSASGGINMGNFEVAAQNVEGKVNKVSSDSENYKSFTVVSNRKAAGNGTGASNTNQPQKQGTPPNNPANPNNPNNPGNHNNPNNPNNPGGDNPQPKPDTFDPSKWIAKYNIPTTCEGPSLGEDKSGTSAQGTSALLNFEMINLGGDKKESSGNEKEALGGKKGTDAGWSPTCVEDTLPKMPKEIADSHKFLIIAGRKDGKYVAVGSDSFEGSLITNIQKAQYADIPGERAKDGFYYIPEHVLNHKIMQDKKTILIVPTGEDINGVKVEPGSLKKDRTAYDKLVGDIEKYTAEQEAAAAAAEAKKAADDAAAKQADQEKINKNKTDMVNQTKEAVEKSNG